jgi:simple sugar transport system ATP-binding protein
VTYAIETNQITKNYGSTVANDRISLAVVGGHIHAVLGENGAGKTTLMKILFGEEMPTEGSIKIFEKPVVIHNPADALKLSIGFIHQHFTLVDEYTIAQNFALGIEPRKDIFFCDYDKVNQKAKQILDLLDISLDLNAPVGSFSVEERQIVEIGKALYRGAQILILDEPTSVLTPQKIEKLLEILRVLRNDGKTIVIITHKLEEALAIADEISVLRKGRLVITLPREEVNRDMVIRLMVGEEPLISFSKGESTFGEPLIQVHDLCVNHESRRVVNRVSFEIHRGEIFGLTGVGGNGQAELVEALVGMRPITEGDFCIDGKSVIDWDIRKRRLAGMAYVPENRVTRGAAISLPVVDNIVNGHHYRPEFHRGLLLNQARINALALKIIQEYDVVTSSLDINAGSLSGGNLQKLVIGREFSLSTPFLIVAYPSQGIDIRTTKYVHSELNRRRNAGCAILLVSGDLDEIFSLCDRIGVMYSGEMVTIKRPEETNRFELGKYMVGSNRDIA